MTRETVPPAMITFSEGWPGFETCRQYQLMVSAESDPFAIVPGIGRDGPSFVAIDPARVVAGYALVIDPADLGRLGSDGSQQLLFLCIVTVHEDGRASVNLRAPLVINPASLRGIQIVTPESPFASTTRSEPRRHARRERGSCWSSRESSTKPS
jgi:flagellar assembly factor FliW